MSDIEKQPPIDRLLDIMARLRDPQRGCEWDLAQDFATIAPYTIEEAYEVADAIARGDMADLKDELGDLLFQVVFHARMAEEAGHFAFADVAASISAKMEARHPHIFGDAAGTMDETRWEDLKADERAAKGVTSALDGVALALPALMRAQKLQNAPHARDLTGRTPQAPKRKFTKKLMNSRPLPQTSKSSRKLAICCSLWSISFAHTA
jgi:nucleoside triphosphate diphosphatase